MAISVVYAASLPGNWPSGSFSSPTISVAYQTGDYVVVMSWNYARFTGPTGYTMASRAEGSPNVGPANIHSLWYKQMTAAGSSLVLTGLSGQGEARLIIIRGATSGVVKSGDYPAQQNNTITYEGLNALMVTTTGAASTEYRNAGYTILYSNIYGTANDSHGIAYKTFSGVLTIPSHALYGDNEPYLVFSDGTPLTSSTISLPAMSTVNLVAQGDVVANAKRSDIKTNADGALTKVGKTYTWTGNWPSAVVGTPITLSGFLDVRNALNLAYDNTSGGCSGFNSSVNVAVLSANYSPNYTSYDGSFNDHYGASDSCCDAG